MPDISAEMVAEMAECVDEEPRNICVVDLNVIKTMAFRGTGVCSEKCRKIRAGEPIAQYKVVVP